MPAIQLWSVSGTENTLSVGNPDAGQSKLEGLSSAFSNYMQQTTANSAQAAVQQNTVQSKTFKTPNSADTGIRQDYAQYQAKSAAQAEKIADSTDTVVDAETAGDALQEAAEEIKDVLKEELGIDDQQIEEAMELLGLTQTDLLNPQQLIALTVELTDSQDAGMMLFRGDFQNIMQEAAAVTQDLLQDLGITMEQLMEQVNQMSQEPAGPQILTEPVQAADVSDADSSEGPQNVFQPEVSDADLPEKNMQQEVQASNQDQLLTADQTRMQLDEVQQPQMTQQPQNDLAEQILQPEQEQQAEILQPEQMAQTEEQDGQQTLLQQESQNDQESQSERGETVLHNNTDTEFRSRSTQHTRFDFNAEVPREQSVNVNTPPVQNAANQTPLPQINVQDVIQQIVEYTKINLSEDIKSIEMQLNPENLGRVYLHISEKEGAVTAQITAQNENLKEALMQQAVILKENLSQQGVKVDAVEVSVGTHEFESNLEKDAHQQEEQARQQEEQNSRRSRRSINLNALEDLDGISGLMSEEEALVAQIMRDNGNSVDYKA